MRHEVGSHRNNGHEVQRVTPLVKELRKVIAEKWAHEFRDCSIMPDEDGIIKLLITALAKEVVKELRGGEGEASELLEDTLIVTNRGPASKGMAKAERKLAKLAKHGHPDDEDGEKDEEGSPSSKKRGEKYPNLKYRQPKYKNVESILKFVESKEEKSGGVKLVIMNFND